MNKYFKEKNRIIKRILDIYEFKLNYDKKELIMIYFDIKDMPLKYLVYYYQNLIENL